MKKITALIMMALLITIGGVYAAWNYSEGNATASSPRDAVNIALTTANDAGSNGAFSFSNAVELSIDDDENDGIVHLAVLKCEGSIVITFTPASTANGDVKAKGIPMKVDATYTPVEYNGKKVIYISEGAFSGGEVTTLILTDDTNVRAFAVDSFKGASTLTDIIIYYMNEADILPPPSFYGASSSLRVHVPKDSGYESGYYWSERGLKFVKDID